MQRAIFLGMREDYGSAFIAPSKTNALKAEQPIPIGYAIKVARRKVDYPTSFIWEVVECQFNKDFVGEILADWELSFEHPKPFKEEDWL